MLFCHPQQTLEIGCKKTTHRRKRQAPKYGITSCFTALSMLSQFQAFNRNKLLSPSRGLWNLRKFPKIPTWKILEDSKPKHLPPIQTLEDGWINPSEKHAPHIGWSMISPTVVKIKDIWHQSLETNKQTILESLSWLPANFFKPAACPAFSPAVHHHAASPSQWRDRFNDSSSTCQHQPYKFITTRVGFLAFRAWMPHPKKIGKQIWGDVCTTTLYFQSQLVEIQISILFVVHFSNETSPFSVRCSSHPSRFLPSLASITLGSFPEVVPSTKEWHYFWSAKGPQGLFKAEEATAQHHSINYFLRIQIWKVIVWKALSVLFGSSCQIVLTNVRIKITSLCPPYQPLGERWINITWKLAAVPVLGGPEGSVFAHAWHRPLPNPSRDLQIFKEQLCRFDMTLNQHSTAGISSGKWLKHASSLLTCL